MTFEEARSVALEEARAVVVVVAQELERVEAEAEQLAAELEAAVARVARLHAAGVAKAAEVGAWRRHVAIARADVDRLWRSETTW